MEETADVIAPSLTEFFNKSLRLGCLLEDWKLANIVLVFKKDNKEQAENYRPISLRSIVSKVMERCLFNAIRDYVFNLISVCQRGFIAERSCVTQLVDVLDQIGTKLDTGGQVDIIYLDMSKSVDTVNHAKLLRKLHQYGFWVEPSAHCYIDSYLHNRSQRVTILVATSSPLPVTLGVPHGSNLGPMLFLLYVNSLPDAVRSSQIATFADDTKIFKEITPKLDAEQLQGDLSNLITWSDSASLNFNYNKCKVQLITRKLKPVIFVYHMAGCQLEVVWAEKDLGVYITDNLTWNKQVNMQYAKASRILGYVRRNSRLVKSITVRRSANLP